MEPGELERKLGILLGRVEVSRKLYGKARAANAKAAMKLADELLEQGVMSLPSAYIERFFAAQDELA